MKEDFSKHAEEFDFFNLSHLRNVAVLYIVIGYLVFFNSLFGAFIWDDYSQIVNNFSVHSLTNFLSFFLGSTFAPEASTGLAGIYYRPLLTLSYAFLYSIFGPNPFPFHLFQVSIHISNAILLFIFLKRLLTNKISFLLGLFFLVHPIQVEAVAFIAALQEPLFFFFGITALTIYQKKELTLKHKALISTLLLFSMLSKETGILFFVSLLLYGVVFKFKKKLLLTSFVILVVPLLLYILLRFVIAKVYFQRLTDVPIMNASLAERITTMPAIINYYLKTFFFPKDLSIFQVWIVSSPGIEFYLNLIMCTMFFSILILLGYWIYKKKAILFRKYIFFIAILTLGLGAHMQIVPLDMTVAERWFYFPMIGMLGILGIVYLAINNTFANKNKTAITFILIILVAALSTRTIIRNTNWYNGFSLYSHDVQAVKTNDKLLSLYAVELINAGKYKEAQKYLEDILRRNPTERYHNLNLGVAYEYSGNIQKAKITYKKALPDDSTGGAYSNLARIALIKEDDPKQTLLITEEALYLYPNNGKIWLFQALAKYELANREESLKDAKKALDLMPTSLTKNTYNKIYNGEPVTFKTDDGKRVIIQMRNK